MLPPGRHSRRRSPTSWRPLIAPPAVPPIISHHHHALVLLSGAEQLVPAVELVVLETLITQITLICPPTTINTKLTFPRLPPEHCLGSPTPCGCTCTGHTTRPHLVHCAVLRHPPSPVGLAHASLTPLPTDPSLERRLCAFPSDSPDSNSRDPHIHTRTHHRPNNSPPPCSWEPVPSGRGQGSSHYSTAAVPRVESRCIDFHSHLPLPRSRTSPTRPIPHACAPWWWLICALQQWQAVSGCPFPDPPFHCAPLSIIE